jgi:hypothetical protein
MDENDNDKARALEEQAARSRDLLRELSHLHGDWPDPLVESSEPTQDELDLPYSQVPGHRWNGWYRLTADEDYYAACSCGWRSTETADVRPMLGQVKDHLDAVRQSLGWRRSARAPGRGESGPDVGGGRDRALSRARPRASRDRGRRANAPVPVSEPFDGSAVSQRGAGRLPRDRAGARGTGKDRGICAKRGDRAAQGRACERVAQGDRRRRGGPGDHNGGNRRDSSGTGHEEAIDWICGERLMQPTEAKPSSGKAHDK